MKKRVGVVNQEATTLTSLENRACGELAPRSHLTDPLFLLWEDVISIITLISFNLALTVLADLRSCLLSLRTRILILLANGIIEALLRCSCAEQRERECYIHNSTSREKCRGNIHRAPMTTAQWFLGISLNVAGHYWIKAVWSVIRAPACFARPITASTSALLATLPANPVWISSTGSDAVTDSSDGGQQLFHVPPGLEHLIRRHQQAAVLFAGHELMTPVLRARGTRGDPDLEIAHELLMRDDRGSGRWRGGDTESETASP